MALLGMRSPAILCLMRDFNEIENCSYYTFNALQLASSTFYEFKIFDLSQSKGFPHSIRVSLVPAERLTK
jgi:hypothetical protein